MNSKNSMSSIKIRYGRGDFKRVGEVKKKYACILKAVDVLEDTHQSYIDIYYHIIDLGYERNNIFILCGRELALTNYEQSHNLPLAKKYFKEVIDELEKVVSEDDTYLFYVKAHGYRKHLGYACIGEASICLPKEYLSESVLEKQLTRIKPNYAVNVIDACFSGKIAERLGRENRVSISTSAGNQTGYASGLVHTILEKMCNDSDVSLEQAFDYAVNLQRENTFQLVYEKICPNTIRL